MKTAIFGGSFDPVHSGHLALARTVREQTVYSRILFIPAASPPHKHLSGGADAADRTAMLKEVLDPLEWACIWTGEMDREGPSYSIDTVRQLKEEGIVSGRPGFIIGDDLAEGFSSWKKAGELAAEVEIILARRLSGPPPLFPFPCLRLDNELWPHSSTDLRSRIARGESLEGLVPESVAAYIAQRGLYAAEHRT